MRDKLLVTGATGSVGVEIVKYLLQHHRSCDARFLIRATTKEQQVNRWRRVLAVSSDNSTSPEDVPNFQPVVGDITLPDLGLGDQIKPLQETITHIIHAAGNVSFIVPLDISRKDNVEGTKRVLDFAETCPRLSRFGYLSTIFVAGKRSGDIKESELEHSAGFGSVYEQTKYEAEVLVKERLGRLPTAIYRLALLPGRTDGYIHHYGVFHQGLQFYYCGLIPVFPGNRDAIIDLFPMEYAANILMRLFFEHFEAGRTYHICSGNGGIPAHRLVGIMTKTYSETSLAWKRGDHTVPEFVNQDTYKLFEKSVTETRDSTFIKVIKIMNTMVSHLIYPKVFDNSTIKSLSVIPPTAVSVDAFFVKILKACVASDWGRKVVNPLEERVNG